MISAYLVLGVPGNASAADIETAYQRVTASSQRTAQRTRSRHEAYGLEL